MYTGEIKLPDRLDGVPPARYSAFREQVFRANEALRTEASKIKGHRLGGIWSLGRSGVEAVELEVQLDDLKLARSISNSFLADPVLLDRSLRAMLMELAGIYSDRSTDEIVRLVQEIREDRARGAK